MNLSMRIRKCRGPFPIEQSLVLFRKFWKGFTQYFKSVERPPNLDGFLGYVDRHGTYHDWAQTRMDRFIHH